MLAHEVEAYFVVRAEDIPEFMHLLRLGAFDLVRDREWKRRNPFEKLKGNAALVREEALRIWSDYESGFVIEP